MRSENRGRRRLAALHVTLGQGDYPATCSIPGCGKPTMFASGSGIASMHCRSHVEFKARHGSHWHGTYRSAELQVYIKAAERWLKANPTGPGVVFALQTLDWQMRRAGPVDPAMNLRGQPAAYRAKIAFARLREAGIKAERLLAIFLGVVAIIEDDRGSHRIRDFRLVQAAKAVHRLASGTHRRWDMWSPTTGGTVPVVLHAYPESSGIVLRRIGEVLEEACGDAAGAATTAIIELKSKQAGPHPSHLPGWKASWAR